VIHVADAEPTHGGVSAELAIEDDADAEACGHRLAHGLAL
jgi:hypothetical protein